ncbi:MAG: SUMF1/EgtB/PvdO family nonheme iron enzyme [Bacteroidales bacterium]|nr:SUMF1/EgtB/PvdO family nonheme iron enzyme [Bacteroidales bacterium]
MSYIAPSCRPAILLMLTSLAVLSSCEMKEETLPDPEVEITFPGDGQSFVRGTPVKTVAWLKGFTEDYTVHRIQLLLDDSTLVHRQGYNQEISYLLETGYLPVNSYQLTFEAAYTSEKQKDKDWNFFSIRDYIEKEDDTDTLYARTSVGISITGPSSPGFSMDYAEFAADTLRTENDTFYVDSFAIGLYEVTNTQYARFLNAIGADSTGQYGNQKYIHLSANTGITYQNSSFTARTTMEERPVVNVTWAGAQNFCRWMGGRLPTEVEWYMAAGTNYDYSGSNTADLVAWYQGNSNDILRPVGRKSPNDAGIYDMSGNAAEWCWNWLDTDTKAYRGGHYKSPIYQVRVTRRFSMPPENGGNFLGFRVLIPR